MWRVIGCVLMFLGPSLTFAQADSTDKSAVASVAQADFTDKKDEAAKLEATLKTDQIKLFLSQAVLENNIENIKTYAVQLKLSDLVRIVNPSTGGTLAHAVVSEAQSELSSTVMLEVLYYIIRSKIKEKEELQNNTVGDGPAISLEDFFNTQDKQGKTPLHLAAERDFSVVVTFLAQNIKGAVATKDNKGFLPAHLAALAGHKFASLAFYKVVSEGARGGVIPVITDNNNLHNFQWPKDNMPSSALSSAPYLEVINYLALQGEISIFELPYQNFQWYSSQNKLEEALDKAVKRGHFYVIHKIAQDQDKWWYKENQEHVWTRVLVLALHKLSGAWAPEPQKQEAWEQIVKLAIQKGADVNNLKILEFGPDRELLQPSIMHLAVATNNLRVVKLLGQAGASYYKGRQSPTQYAARRLESKEYGPGNTRGVDVEDQKMRYALWRRELLEIHDYLQQLAPKALQGPGFLSKCINYLKPN